MDNLLHIWLVLMECLVGLGLVSQVEQELILCYMLLIMKIGINVLFIQWVQGNWITVDTFSLKPYLETLLYKDTKQNLKPNITQTYVVVHLSLNQNKKMLNNKNNMKKKY